MYKIAWETSSEMERESQHLQKCWSEVRYTVRCIYRQTGTPLAESQDPPQEQEKESMKELVDRLCRKDPYQLYQRLEQQAREYVLEVSERLLKHLPQGAREPTEEQGLPEAHHFLSLLLEEYSALCQAACTISAFLPTLENKHLERFHVTWELHNKHLFEKLVFSEPLLRSSWSYHVAQLRQGVSPQYSFSEDMYTALLKRCQQLEQDMAEVATRWLECEKRIGDCVDQQLLFTIEGQSHTNQSPLHTSLFSKNTPLKTKQRTLKDDWEFLKQRNFVEDQLTHPKISDGSFTDTMREMLSSRLSIPDCPNCSYRRRCTCDACSLSHILTCSTADPHVEPFLPEECPPVSSSTITQQYPCVLRTGRSLAFGSNTDSSALIKSFTDVYDYHHMGTGANGNCGGEKIILKDECSPISRSSRRSCSSSDADGEGGDRESSEESPPGKRSTVKDDSRSRIKPASYLSQQAEQLQRACECHVCKQEVPGPAGMVGSPASRLHASPPFFAENASHPALHLYPHIHGQLPLHNVSHFPRPPLRPPVFPSAAFAHTKILPLAPTSEHIGKQQTFSPSLPDHMFQTCFGAATDWGHNPHCQPLKLENIWDATLKSWNPPSFFEEPLPGDIPGPAVLETSLDAPLPSSNEKPVVPMETKETKGGVSKKCPYNFQEALPEGSRVVMATSSATSSVSSTATTVQSSSNQMKISSKRPSLLGDIFHSVAKEEHRHTSPSASRSSPTALSPLPALTAPSLSVPLATHLPTGPQHLPKAASTAPAFLDVHPSLCSSSAELPPSQTEGSVRTAPNVCSDPDCEAHRCEGSNAFDPQTYEGEESQDEDSCSEHSSSTSTSTNQKEGKYCDCCYCEFFGHGGPPAAPTSRNYAEMREKLRLRLTKRKEEQPKKDVQQVVDRENVEDHRNVEELLQFINSEDAKPSSSSRAAKRARHKQRKMEERTRLEEETRERERQQACLEDEAHERECRELLAQPMQRGDDALKKEIIRQLQAAKKKKKDRTKEAPGLYSPQLLKESAQHALESLVNGKTQLLFESSVGDGDVNRDHLRQLCQLLSQNVSEEKVAEALPIPESQSRSEPDGKSARSRGAVDDTARDSTQAPRKTETGTLQTSSSPQPETGPIAAGSPTIKNGCRKQTEAAQMQEKMSTAAEASIAEPEQQIGKPDSAESPQPKSKAKNKKKKKGEKLNNYIDDVFLPKDIDLNSVEMDETEREVEYFKRFCLDSARQTRQRLSINWSNFSFKKATFAGH
ncbi:protein FAM193A-like [Arapaima gigas]